MKKCISLVLVLSIIFSFTACSSANRITGVPDRYLVTNIEEYYYDEELEGNYSFTSVHDYDEASNTDRVEIQLRINHAYADEVVTGACTYQYDKASDNWTMVGSVRWGEMALEYKPEAFKTTLRGTWFSTEWEVSIQELDLSNCTITCKIRLTDSNGMKYESEGYNTYSLNKGYWYSFSFTANGEKYNATLYEDSGMSIYTDHSNPW